MRVLVLTATAIACFAVGALTGDALAQAASAVSSDTTIGNWVSVFANIPALGFVIWLAHRMTTTTIPRLVEDFKTELKDIRADFRDVLETQRADFSEMVKSQQQGFESMLVKQADAHEAAILRDREFQKTTVDAILGQLRAGQ